VAATGLHPTSEGWNAAFTLVWTGDLPGPTRDYGSACSFELLDEHGDVGYSSRELPFGVGETEAQRVGAPTFQLDEDPGDLRDVAVTCDRPSRGFIEDLNSNDPKP
jgi:hypothetical protein